VALATSRLTGPEWGGDIKIIDVSSLSPSASSSSSSGAAAATTSNPLQAVTQAQLTRNVGVADVAVALTGEKSLALAATDDGKMVGWFFSHASETFPHTVWGVNAHSSRVSSIHLSSNPERLLTTSWTGEIKIWDLSTAFTSTSSDFVAPQPISSFTCA